MVALIDNFGYLKGNRGSTLKQFILFLQKELPLINPIEIRLVGHRTGRMTTGVRSKLKGIKVLAGNRMFIDVMKTLAHEWVHEYQWQIKQTDRKSTKGDPIGSWYENEANAKSGELVRKFNKIHPEKENVVYEHKQKKTSIYKDMAKIIKLTENDLRKIIRRVLVEQDMNDNGKYFTLGGFYFYYDGEKMSLAKKDEMGNIVPDKSIIFPSTQEISVIWSNTVQEVDDENIKGIELAGLEFDDKMVNAMKYGSAIYNKNEAIMNFGSLTPIVFYSQKYNGPTVGGMVVSSEFPDGVEGELNLIDARPGNKIFFQQSAFKSSKEFGISLKIGLSGQEINPSDFGTQKKNITLPKTYNIGDFFTANSSKPSNLTQSEFFKNIKNFINSGGRIDLFTITASPPRVPAGCVENDCKNGKWKEDITDYSKVISGYEDNTGNTQLSKKRAIETYNSLIRDIDKLKSVPYILKVADEPGGFVHIKFE